VAGWRDGDKPVRFAANGRTLYVVGGGLPIRIEELDVSSGARRLWRQFDPSDPAGLQVTYEPVVISPDGRAVACNYSRRLSTLFLGEGIR
jgi:hypothetical protein